MIIKRKLFGVGSLGFAGIDAVMTTSGMIKSGKEFKAATAEHKQNLANLKRETDAAIKTNEAAAKDFRSSLGV